MKYVLAPMAGFTDSAFRRLCERHGADLTYTEMVSAAALAHGSSQTLHLIETLPGESRTAVQVFGAKVDEVAFASRCVSDIDKRRISNGLPGFVALDLNAGCPMPKITQCGAGSALVKDPKLCNELLKAMKAETDLPVTMKTRPGPRPDCVMMYELLAAAEDAGCAGITMHGRFTSKMHGGRVEYELLGELVNRAKIPVCGNGGVVDFDSARAIADTGVDSVMIGRGALANPWIFGRLKKACTPEEFALSAPGAEERERTFDEHLAGVIELHDLLETKYPDDHVPSRDGWACIAVHTHLFRYFNGRPGAAEFRRKLGGIRTLDDLRSAIANIGR